MLPVMDSVNGGNGSSCEPEEVSSSQKERKLYSRHSPEQIQQLEAFFKECPHPDENQRKQLSKQTGLDPKQIKFWFQNKRTQSKVHSAKAANHALKTDNEKIYFENLAIKESLNNLKCQKCDRNFVGERDRYQNMENLRKENSLMKQELQKASNMLCSIMGKSITEEQVSIFLEKRINLTGIERQIWDVPSKEERPPYQLLEIDEKEKCLMVETATRAMEELIELWRVDEPLWVKSSRNSEYFVHPLTYNSRFPKINRLRPSSNICVESSKDSVVVPFAALRLVHIFSDARKWMEFFTTIVTKSSTIATIDTAHLLGSLHLMHAKLHVLSPLVASRDFIFLRCVRRLDSTTWAVADVSYRCFDEIHGPPMRCWKFPSGCIIKELSNETSRVTWIEHVQVDHTYVPNHFYDDSTYGSQAYGAGKWIATLQRMCERSAFLRESRYAPRFGLDGVINGSEGRKRLMELSKRMVKNFCEILCVSDKQDYSCQSEYKDDNLHFFVRKNTRQGEPLGTILCVATSLWLPISYEKLFNVIKNENIRGQWDFLAQDSPVIEIAHISTSYDPGDSIAIMQLFGPKENKMLIHQETSIDSSGGFVVYTPIELSTISTLISGEGETSKIPILPSGFVLSSDERGQVGRATGASTSTRSNSGCFMTAILQMCDPGKESITAARSIINFTIENIKKAICDAE